MVSCYLQYCANSQRKKRSEERGLGEGKWLGDFLVHGEKTEQKSSTHPLGSVAQSLQSELLSLFDEKFIHTYIFVTT